MKKYKLIAADLDDTLLNDKLQVSEENKIAIKKAQEMGTTFTIATGRMFRSAYPIAKELDIKGPIISYQGAYIKNVENGEVLVEYAVPIELAKEVIKTGYDAGVHINLYINDKLYVDSVTSEGIMYSNQAKVDLNPVGNLLDFINCAPTKIIYIADSEILNTLQNKLQEKYGKSLYITKSKPYYLEFLHPHASKGYALKKLAEEMGIARDEIICFGDSYNDIDMIEFAGLGVAMGNAPEDIKKIADSVADTNNNNGVAKFLSKYVLNNNANE